MSVSKTFDLCEDDAKRLIVIAMRAGKTVATIMRCLIAEGIEAYEAEHGPLSIEGVSPYSWRRQYMNTLSESATDESAPSSSASTAA